MRTLDLLAHNLLSPMILSFALGVVARLVRSDLAIPEALSKTLAIFLLLAIGMKGGASLDAAGLSGFGGAALATVGLGGPFRCGPSRSRAASAVSGVRMPPAWRRIMAARRR